MKKNPLRSELASEIIRDNRHKAYFCLFLAVCIALCVILSRHLDSVTIAFAGTLITPLLTTAQGCISANNSMLVSTRNAQEPPPPGEPLPVEVKNTPEQPVPTEETNGP